MTLPDWTPEQYVAVLVMAVVCLYAALALLVRLTLWLEDWQQALEERRRREDLADFRAQLAAMTDREEAALRKWAYEQTARNLAESLAEDETPIYTETAVERLLATLDDPEQMRRYGVDGGAA